MIQKTERLSKIEREKKEIEREKKEIGGESVR